MSVTITPIYASLIALIFFALCWRVIAYRRAHKLSLGDEGNRSLLRRMRAQANCAEYAPFGLLLLLMLEMQSGNVVFVHAMGLCLLLGRAAHAYGFASKPMNLPMRQLGMVLTFIQLIATSIALLLAALI
ncbi:MAPEG family protein [Cognatishimia sp. D5M38]|uniref:MAPEG family protein n=1 Tax=Cognatishimia coralii TaxID=3083254 RepID=A0ABU8QFH1_9RHOB